MGTTIGSITAYGSYLFGQAIYRDNGIFFDVGSISISVEEVELRFYNARGEIGRVSTGTGESALGKVKFEYLPTGCGKLDFTLINPPPFIIDPGMRVDVHAFRDPVPWYSGLVLNKPALGSTNRNLRFEGHGWFDALEHIVLHNNDGSRPTKFQNTEVATIVVSIFQDYISPLGSIIFNPGKIIPTGYIAIDTDFELATAKEAFEDLAALAFNYEIGIDEARNFFFRPISDTIQFSRFVTKHADTITVEENFSDMANRLYVKHALTVNSETVHNVFVKEDITSQAVYGLREKHVTAPTIVDTIDADRWGQFKLNEIKNPIRKARVKGTDITTKYIVKGNCRVFALLDPFDFSDEFNDAFIDNGWRKETVLNPAATFSANGSFTETNSTMTVQAQVNGNMYDDEYFGSFIYKQLSGDFEIVTSAVTISNPFSTHDHWSQGIHVRADRNNWITCGRYLQPGVSDPANESRLDTTDQVTVLTEVFSVPAIDASHYKLRREGKVFRCCPVQMVSTGLR